MAQQGPAKNSRTSSDAQATEAAKQAEASYEELKAQIEILKADLTELSAAVLRAGKTAAQEEVNHARAKGRERAEQAADQVEDLLAEAEIFARKRPGLALGLAAGAGFLLALAMSRR